MCLFSSKFRGQDDQGGFLDEATWNGSPKKQGGFEWTKEGVL